MKEQMRRDKSYYHALYQEWKSSGEGVGLFCKRKSVRYCTFRYWVKKIEASSGGENGFTELDVIGFGSEAVAVLHFSGGSTLSFYHLPDALWLKRLLS